VYVHSGIVHISGTISVSMNPSQMPHGGPQPQPQPIAPQPFRPHEAIAPLPQSQPLQPAIQPADNGQYYVVPPPAPSQHSSGHNPYEFIVAPNSGHQPGATLFGGNKFLQQIGLLVGGTVAVIVVGVILASVLVPNKSSTAALTTIAQKQQEIIRVATLGVNQATSQSAKNLAINTQLGVGSSQTDTLAYLAAHGAKINPKVLVLGHSSQTDQTLASAKETSTFDSALEQVLMTQLTSYQNSLRAAYKAAASKTAKTLLQKDYTSASLLLEQAKSSS
jgi:hypothetical protein